MRFCGIHPTTISHAIVLHYEFKYYAFNSLAPGKFKWNFRQVIFKQILVNDGRGFSCEIALIWMSLDYMDDQSTLVQVMAWCREATSHYLSKCWPRSLSPYGVTRPQWVKITAASSKGQCINWLQNNCYVKGLFILKKTDIRFNLAVDIMDKSAWNYATAEGRFLISVGR